MERETEIEIFVPVTVDNYERTYQISNFGRVKSLQRTPANIMNPCVKNGYHNVCLSYKGTKKNFQVARLVAFAFIFNDDEINKTKVHHLDGNKLNDFASNLVWVNPNSKYVDTTENNRYSVAVNQLSKDGVIINSFPSIKIAAQETEACEEHISSVCRGKEKNLADLAGNTLTIHI